MSKTVKFTSTGEVELTYDENSREFKEAFEAYKDMIDINANIESMLNHVAFHVTRYGTDSMVEGVGYVGYNGKIPDKELYSGIMVSEDYDEFDFQMQ